MASNFNARLYGIAALLTSVTLAACTAPRAGAGHGAHHRGQGDGSSTQSGTAATGSAAPPSGQTPPGSTDMSQMCAMHRDMQHGRPGQQQAMMEQQMRGMSPEMRQQHMDKMREMMRQHCQ